MDETNSFQKERERRREEERERKRKEGENETHVGDARSGKIILSTWSSAERKPGQLLPSSSPPFSSLLFSLERTGCLPVPAKLAEGGKKAQGGSSEIARIHTPSDFLPLNWGRKKALSCSCWVCGGGSAPQPCLSGAPLPPQPRLPEAAGGAPPHPPAGTQATLLGTRWDICTGDA